MSAARRGAGAAVAALGGAAAAGALAACVEIATAPGGIASIRLDPLPPSIVAGDSLRDSTGAVTRLRAVAFGEGSAPIEGTAFTFGALRLPADSGRGADTALVVDAARGTVRATLPRLVDGARVSARVGDRLQVLDTLAIVPRPTRLVRAPQTDSAFVLRYLCTDAGTELRQNVAIGADTLGNVTPALDVLLQAVGARDTVAVPRYLVRYDVVAPSVVPRGTAPHRDERPALYPTTASADRPLRYDTTNAQGRTGTRLRVLPSLLTRAVAPDTLAVRIRASAIVGAGQPLPAPVEFAVRLVRRPPRDATLAACP